jgi:hypothetical protein
MLKPWWLLTTKEKIPQLRTAPAGLPKHSPTSISRPSIFSPSLHRLDTAMKHALASPDPDELAGDCIHASKRCIPHDANASSLCLDRAFKHRRHLMGVYLINVYLTGVHLMTVHL